MNGKNPNDKIFLHLNKYVLNTSVIKLYIIYQNIFYCVVNDSRHKYYLNDGKCIK